MTFVISMSFNIFLSILVFQYANVKKFTSYKYLNFNHVNYTYVNEISNTLYVRKLTDGNIFLIILN